jgi:hypothetical protein
MLDGYQVLIVENVFPTSNLMFAQHGYLYLTKNFLCYGSSAISSLFSKKVSVSVRLGTSYSSDQNRK